MFRKLYSDIKSTLSLLLIILAMVQAARGWFALIVGGLRAIKEARARRKM